MPALVKALSRLPRFVPHLPSQSAGASARAGNFSSSKSTNTGLAPQSRNASNIEDLAHDARNVLSSLTLYGELLAMPGVLSPQCRHHAQELQGIAQTATQMVEALIVQAVAAPTTSALPNAIPAGLPTVPVTDAAEELRHLQPLLAAIAGPAIQLSVATMPCAGRTALAVEDFTRILINLVRNSADAMPSGGHVRITAQYDDGFSFLEQDDVNNIFGPPQSIVITVSDDGPGVSEANRKQIFETGFTTRRNELTAPRRRGLGLSIVRNLVEAAGGTVRLVQRQGRGTRFDIQLPITSGTYAAPTNSAFAVTHA